MQVKEKCKRISTYILSLALAICFIIFSKESIKEIKAGMVAIKGVSNYFTLKEPESSFTVSDITVSDYGQYIDIGTEILTKTVALEDGTLPKSDWRVFKKEDDGVWLILSDYMPKEKLPSGTGLTAVSSDSSYPYSINHSSSRDGLITGLNSSSWSGLISGSTVASVSGVRVKGAFELEEWIESWEDSGYTNINTAKKTGMSAVPDWGYYVYKDGESSTETYTSLSSDAAGYANTLYFPHKSGLSNCSAYWLASPSATYAGSVMLVGYYGNVGNNSFNNSYQGVRPAVFLPNNIELNTNGDVWTIKKTVADISVSDYGQYIDIGTDILDLSSVTLADGSHPKSDWRVFKKDSTGAWLILSDYMPNSAFDVTSLGLSVGDTGYTAYGVRSTVNRADLIGKLENESGWSALISGSHVSGVSGVKVRGALSLNDWIESFNSNSEYSQLEALYYASPVTDVATAEGYKLAGGFTDKVEGSTPNTNGYYAYVSRNGYENTLYFPRRSVVDNCYGYWLASPSALSASYVMYVYCIGDVNNYSSYSSYLGVRPAVYLPSNISLDTDSDVWNIVSD